MFLQNVIPNERKKSRFMIFVNWRCVTFSKANSLRFFLTALATACCNTEPSDINRYSSRLRAPSFETVATCFARTKLPSLPVRYQSGCLVIPLSNFDLATPRALFETAYRSFSLAKLGLQAHATTTAHRAAPNPHRESMLGYREGILS